MARIGYTKCGLCPNPEAAVSETSAGTLSLSCHRCEFSGYAKRGTKAFRLITEAMTREEGEQPAAPAPAPAPVPTPRKQAAQAPAPTPPKTARANDPFSLGAL